MSGPGSSPLLQHTDSSLSLRTRKTSNQDVRVLATENLARKGSPVVGDERIILSSDQPQPIASHADYQENDGLLSEVIDMGTPDIDDDNWYYNGNNNGRSNKETWRKKWVKNCSVVRYQSNKFKLLIAYLLFVLGLRFTDFLRDIHNWILYYNNQSSN
jgi:hypothetical protein